MEWMNLLETQSVKNASSRRYQYKANVEYDNLSRLLFTSVQFVRIAWNLLEISKLFFKINNYNIIISYPG